MGSARFLSIDNFHREPNYEVAMGHSPVAGSGPEPGGAPPCLTGLLLSRNPHSRASLPLHA
jgi:hypothetical protein